MKNIYLLTITFLLGVITLNRTFAQSKTSFEIEGSVGVPTKPQYSTVIGGDLKIRQQLSEKWSVALSAGVHHFITNESRSLASFENGSKDYWDMPWTVVPIRAELRYGFYNGWFVQGKTGIAPALETKAKFAWSVGVGKSWNNRWGVSLNYEDFGFKINKFVGASVFYSPRFKKYKYNKMNLNRSEAWSVSVYGMYGTIFGDTTGSFGNFGLEFANHLNDKLEVVADASYMTSTSNMLVARLGLRYQFYKPFFVGVHFGEGFELPGFANVTGGVEIGSKITNKISVSLQLDKYQRYNSSLLGVKVGYKL